MVLEFVDIKRPMKLVDIKRELAFDLLKPCTEAIEAKRLTSQGLFQLLRTPPWV
jgi:hypothetical protein